MIDRAFCVFLVVSSALGCTAATDTSNIIENTPVPTEIVVDPGAFLGYVPCDSRPGSMQSYVATVTDQGVAGCKRVDESCKSPDDYCCSGSCNGVVCTGEDPPPFTLPSSQSTPPAPQSPSPSSSCCECSGKWNLAFTPKLKSAAI